MTGVSKRLRYKEQLRLVMVVLVMSVVVSLFWVTQPVDPEKHSDMVGSLSRLQRDDARLGEAVLQLNFSLASNNDMLVSLMRDMNETMQQIRELAKQMNLMSDESFSTQLQALELNLQQKEALLERFKSRNAVLKNSLMFLPRNRELILKNLPTQHPLHQHLNDLIEGVFLQRIQGQQLEQKTWEEHFEAAKKSAQGLSPDIVTRLENLLSHLKQVSTYDAGLPRLMHQLTLHFEVGLLETAYSHYYQSRQEWAAQYRFFLFLTTLILSNYAFQAFRRIRTQSRRLDLAASVFSNASEGVVITSTEGIILDVNPAFTQITGYQRDEIIGKNPRVLQSGRHDSAFYHQMWEAINTQGHWQGEIWNRRKSGEVYPEWLAITAARVEKGQQIVVSHYVATFSDISTRKKSEAEIYQLAFYDPLTGLPNRRLLMDRLKHLLSARNLDQMHAALLFIDLDNFKVLNDLKGHEAGDELLLQAAARLRGGVRESDTVARLGGDEFVILLEKLNKEPQRAATEARVVAEKIHHLLDRPYEIKNFHHRSSGSIGICLSAMGKR